MVTLIPVLIQNSVDKLKLQLINFWFAQLTDY